MNRLLALCLPLLLVSSGVVGSGVVEAEEARPANIDMEAAKALAQADNAFARDLYKALGGGDENILFSPYSIQSALLMAREGAVGETAAQIDRVLHVEDLSRGASYRALRDSLRPGRMQDGHGKGAKMRPTYELNVANAVWGQKRYFIKNTFLEPLRDVYRAPLLRVDFGDPVGASRTVNAWAARETRNKIRGVISPDAIPPLTRLILANAVYFKGAWRDEFSKGNTKPEVFHGPDGTKKKVPLMWQKDRHAYTEIEGVQILSLPYLMGETRMTIFLPRAKDGLKDMEEKYVAGKLDGWWAAMKVLEVDVKLPKFEFTAQYELTDALSTLGITDAFELGKADFSLVSDKEDICVGGVVHKAFISVDEEGTEAAAVTAMLMVGSAAPGTPENPIVFRADHPFLFQIVHSKTGAVLFAGRVTKP